MTSYGINLKWKKMVISLLSLLIGLSSCNLQGDTINERIKNKSIVWSILKEPVYIDPGLCGVSDGTSIINNMFEGLYRITEQNKLIFGVAKSCKILNNGKKYIFEIKDDAFWSDGKKVTAADFEFAWKRVLDKNIPSTRKNLFVHIKNGKDILFGNKDKDFLGVKALDDVHLEVLLEYPMDNFKNILALTPFMPVRSDVVDYDGGWAKNPKKFVSNGPFYLKEYKNDRYIILNKNKYYHGTSNLNNIKIQFIEDINTAYVGYKLGKIDIIDFIPFEVLDSIAYSEELVAAPYYGVYFYSFNINIPFFQDVRVRKAISKSINRDVIVKYIRKVGEISAKEYIYPNILDDLGLYQKSIDFNVDEAKKLLDEAGYHDRSKLPKIEILYNNEGNNKVIAEVVQEMLNNNLGLKVNLVNYEWSIFQKKREKLQYNGLVRNSKMYEYIDPISFLEIFKQNGESYTGYNNMEYNDLISNIICSNEESKRKSILRANEILERDVPIIPVFYYSSTTLVKKHIKQYNINSIGYKYFGNIIIN